MRFARPGDGGFGLLELRPQTGLFPFVELGPSGDRIAGVRFHSWVLWGESPGSHCGARTSRRLNFSQQVVNTFFAILPELSRSEQRYCKNGAASDQLARRDVQTAEQTRQLANVRR
jgi:hypothetical protein